MIIRAFLPMKIKRALANGKEEWLPEKNLYGVVLQNGAWRGLSAEDMQYAHETNPQGEPEEGVHYRSFPAGNSR